MTPIKLYKNQTEEYNKTALGHPFPNLEPFLKSIEQYYFAKVSIASYKVKTDHIDMALELQCPLTLMEVLGHFNEKQWGYCEGQMNPLEKTLNDLFTASHLSVDITELNLVLENTQIVIKRVAFNSIATQFNGIMNAIALNYVPISKGLEELPYEIYLPVYEDVFSSETNANVNDNAHKQDYFKYWGIYLESEPEAQIYDVTRRLYIPASLDLCILDED